MATEKIQTELVITNLAHGQQSQQELQGAIQAQQLLAREPRKILAQALAGSGALGDETQLLNAFARMMGARAGSNIRIAGTPVPTGRERVNRRGEVMVDAEGNPLPEMQTPIVSARVRSDPNAHLSEDARFYRKYQIRRRYLGDKSTLDADHLPDEAEIKKSLDLMTNPEATEDDVIHAKEMLERVRLAKVEEAKFMRRSAGLYRKRLGLQAGLETYDPEGKVSRTFQRSLSPEEVEFHKGRMLDPSSDEGQKIESEFALREEMRTRRERARHTRETSRYDQRALKDIDQIEKDISATRKRVDLTKMQERLAAANSQLDKGFFARLGRVFGGAAASGIGMYEPQPREKTPQEKREQRFIDRNKELDEKVAAYRQLSKEERAAPAGRESLDEIKKSKAAIKEEATDLAKEQAVAEERQRLTDKALADRYKLGADVFTGSARELFNPDKSIMTTGLLGGLDKAAGAAQKAGFTSLALGGGPGLAIGATIFKAVTSALTGGLERGTELQKQAEGVYTFAEPVFAREEQMMAARGRTSVRRFSPEAQKRADAAQRRLGDRDLETAGSGTPEDIDIYSNTTTMRLKTLQQNLGSIMGLSAATQAYTQFRHQAGVTDMTTADASLAMKTGFMSGTSPALLARAAQLGAIPGNLGGGLRQGLDYRTDIGTLRYQQETIERAGVTGAPLEAILGQTLSRQEAMAAMGMRTNFDRDAKFQRVLQESNIAPQQFTGITGGIDDIRAGVLQQLQAPGKDILAGLMTAEAFRRGKTLSGAAAFAAKTSGAEFLESTMQGVGIGSGLMELVATSMAPAEQPAMMTAMMKIRQGQTAGPAAATGETTIDDRARGRGLLQFLPEYGAITAQRDMGDKSKMAAFQQTLDSVARAMRDTADNMQALIANVNAITGSNSAL